MARIYLLFSLTFALVLGSSFLSVYGHAPPVRLLSRPKTVSELLTLPFNDITQILNRKEHFAPKTPEFKAMFTMCKGYVAYLESLYKFENPIVDVLGIAKTKYALMTKAILAAQASVIGKVDKKTSKKLRRSCAGLTKGFLQIQEMIVSISAKHHYKANAMINLSESNDLVHALLNFKHYITAFMDVVSDVEEKKIKKVAHHARALEEAEQGDRVRKFFKKFTDRFAGYLGGKTHGRELTEAEFKANSHVVHFFGGYLGGNTSHGRELTEAQFDAAGKMKVARGDGFRRRKP